MKIIFYTAVLLFACHSVAFHNYEGHLAGLDINSVCLTEDSIRSKFGISVCNELVPVVTNAGSDNEYTNWYCGKYVEKKIVLPRTIQKNICVRFKSEGVGENDTLIMSCTRYKTEIVKLPKNITITQEIQSGDSNKDVSYEHTFPDCQ